MADNKTTPLSRLVGHPHFVPIDQATGQPPPGYAFGLGQPISAPPHHEPLRQPQQPPAPSQQLYPDANAYGAGAGDGPYNFAPVNGSSGPTAATQKTGWAGRIARIGAKASDPINALANKMGSHSFLPMALDKECEKAALILRGFCQEGVTMAETLPSNQTTNDPSGHPVSTRKALIKIPPNVLAKACGLAIFTTFRLGFHVSGATGSGIVLARLPDGRWGPPSGISVHSVGGGFLIGADIYDCVCVINSPEALAAFSSHRLSLGSDFAVVAGPFGAGAGLDFGKGKATEKPDGVTRHGRPVTPLASGNIPDQRSLSATTTACVSSLKPVYSYVKSRGLYAGVSVDGTAFVERKDANADFYGGPVSAEAILRGQLPVAAASPTAAWRASLAPLYDVLRTADGLVPSAAGTAGYDSSYAPEASKAGAGHAAAAASYAEMPPPAYDDAAGRGAAGPSDGIPSYQGQRPAGVGDHKQYA